VNAAVKEQAAREANNEELALKEDGNE